MKIARLAASIAAFSLLLVSGCITRVDVVVDPVKPWEGHYMTTEEFKEKTSDIVLAEGETIWVISNNTLKRALKNSIEKAK